MVYTEIKQKNNKEYYYRVKSIRIGKKFKKQRIYLGVNLSPSILQEKEKQADQKLITDKINNGLEKIKPVIIKILKKNNILRAGIFGSYARGEQRKNSDVDILIQPTKNMGFRFAGIEIELAKALKKKVDLLTYNGISPFLKNNILSQEVKII